MARSCFRSKQPISFFPSKRLFKKLIIIYSVVQFLLLCLCEVAENDSLIYLYLRNLMITTYLPSILPENYGKAFIKNRAHSAFQFFENGSGRRRLVPPINSTWLENNPVYSQFQLKEAKNKKRVTVLVIVSSAPRRIDRRQAIRDTWWTECKPVNEVTVECVFMTDYQKKGDPYHHWLKIESQIHKDLYFQHVPGGITFGLRMINHMVFALTQYDFDYFLRVDDDYYFCFHEFLREVPLPMVTNFHWGWVHRLAPMPIVRPEESTIMFSRDLVQKFIEQDQDKILCHPWADQMIAAWGNVINTTYSYHHDNRIHHHPVVSDKPSLRNESNICSKFILVHGTYPDDMRLFWTHHPREVESSPKPNLLNNSVDIPVSKVFDWTQFWWRWRYEPKNCIKNPTWDTSKQFVMGGAYSGREDEGKAPG